MLIFCKDLVFSQEDICENIDTRVYIGWYPSFNSLDMVYEHLPFIIQIWLIFIAWNSLRTRS